jgi:hypothetical protein
MEGGAADSHVIAIMCQTTLSDWAKPVLERHRQEITENSTVVRLVSLSVRSRNLRVVVTIVSKTAEAYQLCLKQAMRSDARNEANIQYVKDAMV